MKPVSPPRIRENVSLLRHHTFRLDVRARYFAEIRSPEELQHVTGGRLRPGRLLILGRGANLLFSGDFDGLVLKMELLGKRVVSEDSESVLLDVAAGEDWPRLVTNVVRRGWGGIENLALVPGTVGAAPVQHIAAYGHNLRDVFVSLEAVSVKDGTTRRFSRDDCGFGYRESVFRRELRGAYVITSVRFRLDKHPALNTSYRSRYESLEDELAKVAREPYGVRDVYNAVVAIRRRKLPDIRRVGTAGSFFKNPEVSRDRYLALSRSLPGLPFHPVGELSYTVPGSAAAPVQDRVRVPAGWLIDQLGWKGKRVGHCGLWPQQALTVVNYGGASPQEVLDLVESIREAFLREYDIALENEVEVV
jgi:UDP-N-acetylmuramate dehydrogenase